MSYLTGDSLQVRIRIAFGASIAVDPATWTWTDVTQWWHAPDHVRIGWGRSSGAEQPETSTLSLTLKNTDGRFTAYDPRSPYWPNVRKWTPIQYDIDLGDGAGWRNRFSGYIRKWPLTWPGASSLMALAKLEAVGVLGRLSRGKPPARSAMRRTIAASGALAYWPMEDGSDAGQAGSAVPGINALTTTGTVAFQDIASWKTTKGYAVDYGTQALTDLSAGTVFTGQLPASVTTATATAAGWSVAISSDLEWGSPPLSADLVLLEVTTSGGTHDRWRVVVTTGGNLQVQAYIGATATLVINAGGVVTSMLPHNLAVWQSGGTIRVGYIHGYSGPGTYLESGSVSGTVGGVTAVKVNATGTTATVPIPAGHLAVWVGHDLAALDSGNGAVIKALFGHAWSNLFMFGGTAVRNGEAATARLARLAAEDGVPLSIPSSDTPVMMGTQRPGTPLDLYQECETADQGLIYESGWGLAYLPRTARYNAPVAVTIDGDLRQLGMPFEPVDDDQLLRNRWTVERSEGASAVAADQESIAVQGEIEGSVTVNLVSDVPLPDHAAWRLHMSTVQEPRYPALSLNLAAHPELAAAWCGCQPGSRVQIVNPPEQNVPGTVDQLVVGASETYRGRRSWQATLNVVPAAPWSPGGFDLSQYDTDGSQTTSVFVAGTGTALTVTTTAGQTWTTVTPFDINVAGVRLRVTGVSGGTSPQTFTVDQQPVNGITKSIPAGTPVHVWQPTVYVL